jgi:hypothetical protein
MVGAGRRSVAADHRPRFRSAGTCDDGPVPSRAELWAYYDRRASEYESGILVGVDDDEATRVHAEGAEVARVLTALVPVVYLEVGAGTGLFTRHLPGRGVVLDQSGAMLRCLFDNLGPRPAVRGDAVALPLRDGAVGRVFAAHLYGHLDDDDGRAFLTEARRVGNELVVLDSARPVGGDGDTWEERLLRDGSSYTIRKRFFTGATLARELGRRSRVLFEGRYFVVVAS